MNEITTQDSQAINIIEKYADKLSFEQLQALPLLAYGMSPRKVSEYVKQPYEIVLSWVRNNASLRGAIDELKVNAEAYHKSMLNQTAVMAWDRIFEFLGETFEPDDRDNRNIQMQLSRFVIGELGLKQVKSQVEHIVPQAKVEESSMDILARKVKELQDRTIKTTYQVIEPDEIEQAKKEIFPIAPDTSYGKMSLDGDRWICHACGERTMDLVVHIRAKHNLSAAKYRTMYELPADTQFFMEKPREISKQEILDIVNGDNEMGV